MSEKLINIIDTYIYISFTRKIIIEILDILNELQVEGHCCRYCGGRLSLTDKTSLSLVQAAADEALEGRAEKLVWHVRRTWSGAVEVLIKKKGDYSEIDILEGLQDVKRTLSSKFRNLYYVMSSIPAFYILLIRSRFFLHRYENRGFYRRSDRCRFAREWRNCRAGFLVRYTIDPPCAFIHRLLVLWLLLQTVSNILIVLQAFLERNVYIFVSIPYV